MTQQLVYTLDDLDALPMGTVVHTHRPLAAAVAGDGTPATPYLDARELTLILVRQPTGWFGAWDTALPILRADVVPCTVLHRPVPTRRAKASTKTSRAAR